MAQNQEEDIADSLSSLRLMDQNIASELKQKLNNFPEILSDEGYGKWFWEVADSITEANLSSIISMLEGYQFSVTEDDDSLELYFASDFGSQVNLTLLCIIRNLKERSFNGINILQKWLDKRSSLKTDEAQAERLQGAAFAIASLNLLSRVQFEFEDLQNLKDSWKSVKRFDELRPKSKAFVYSLKSELLGEFKPCFQIQVGVLDQAIKQDPDHWEWHLNKFKQLSWNRRSDIRRHPCEQETNEIATAYKLNPIHPLCLVKTCQFLAEYLKSTTIHHITNSFPLTVGDIVFTNETDIVKFLKGKAIEFESTKKAWVLEFAKIFSSDLPDRGTAKKFLDIALASCPMSTRINHRIAVFLCQEREYVLAENYLEKAVELSPYRNISARGDLLRSYMRNWERNYEKLRQLFEMEAIDSKLIPTEVMFLKGYFYFKVGEYTKALNSWIQPITVHGDEFDFSKHWKDMFNDYGLAKFWGWPRFDSRSDLLNIQKYVFPVQNRPVEGEKAIAYDKLVATVQALLPRPNRNQLSGIDGN